MSMPDAGGSDPIRVLVVDDSPTACDLLTSLFQQAEGMEVVGVGSDGEEGVRLVERLQPDVVTMDVRMPRMDGFEATRRIMQRRPTPIVIVTASMTRSDMDLTFEALYAGALMVARKPGMDDVETCERLVGAVRLMSDVPVVRRLPSAQGGHSTWESVQLIPEVKNRIQRVGIASSTGGPSALASILKKLPVDFPVPILAVHHITSGFVIGLVEWLDNLTPLEVALAGHGDIPRPGTVLLAPDDYHMRVSMGGVIELSKAPPCNGLRPSADYLFHSLADAYGYRAMAIMLTGIGDDGVAGLVALHQAGGLTVAQDERSCVVYGMPQGVIDRNAVDRVLTLDQIAMLLNQLATNEIR